MAAKADRQGYSKDGIKLVANNKRAFHDYEIEGTTEAGVVLRGSEIKVLRAGKCVISGAHIRVVRGQAVMFGVQIPEYPWAHQFNHEPARERKLLLHKREILKLEVELRQKGSACVVTKLYFKGAIVKVEIAVGIGKKLHDKRETLKDRDAKREIARSIR